MTGQEWVNGYTRKDGTVVEGFWRQRRRAAASERVEAGISILRQGREQTPLDPEAGSDPAGERGGVVIPDGMATFCGIRDGSPRITSGVFIRVERTKNDTGEAHDVLLGPYPSEQVADELLNTFDVDIWCEGGSGSYARDDNVCVEDVTIETRDVGGLEVIIPDAHRSLTDRFNALGNRDDVTFSWDGGHVNVRHQFTETGGQRKGRYVVFGKYDNDDFSTRQEISYDSRRGEGQGGESAAQAHLARVVLNRMPKEAGQ